MKNLNEVYKKLKKNYLNYDITKINNEIILKVDNYNIGNEDMIFLKE